MKKKNENPNWGDNARLFLNKFYSITAHANNLPSYGLTDVEKALLNAICDFHSNSEYHQGNAEEFILEPGQALDEFFQENGFSLEYINDLGWQVNIDVFPKLPETVSKEYLLGFATALTGGERPSITDDDWAEGYNDGGQYFEAWEKQQFKKKSPTGPKKGVYTTIPKEKDMVTALEMGMYTAKDEDGDINDNPYSISNENFQYKAWQLGFKFNE